MSNLHAKIVYYTVIVFAYFWAAIEMIAGEPFDAVVLFIVTAMFHGYRNGVKR